MWGIDLGTTNSTIGRWDAKQHRPQLVAMGGIERPAETPERAVPAPHLIPSATQLIESPSAWARLASRGPLAGRLLGTKSEAHLGAIAASPAGPGGPIPGEAERTIPLRQACGDYLDWYRPPAGR